MLADHFIGQPAAVQQIQIAIDASIRRGTILPHTLLVAGPGLGKTYLAERIAHEAEAPFIDFALPMDRRYLLSVMQFHRGIILLDEIHQADRKTLDSLLPFLLNGKITNGRIVETNLRLTVIAATTDPQKMPDAFRSRFRLHPQFTDYTEDEIAQIVMMKATQRGVELPDGIATGLAEASLGNPRQATHLLDVYTDLAVVHGDSVDVPSVLRHLGYSANGLRPDHIQYLRALERQGGVASQRTLAQMVMLPDDALRWIEKDLLRLGVIGIGSSGRELRTMDWADRLDGVPSTEVVPANCDLNPYTLEPRQ